METGCCEGVNCLERCRQRRRRSVVAPARHHGLAHWPTRGRWGRLICAVPGVHPEERAPLPASSAGFPRQTGAGVAFATTQGRPFFVRIEATWSLWSSLRQAVDSLLTICSLALPALSHSASTFSELPVNNPLSSVTCSLNAWESGLRTDGRMQIRGDVRG